jgi:hypothetical protein
MEDEYLSINGKKIKPELIEIWFLPVDAKALGRIDCYINFDRPDLLPADGSPFPIVYRRGGASIDQDFKLNTVAPVGSVYRYQLVSAGEARSGEFDLALLRR